MACPEDGVAASPVGIYDPEEQPEPDWVSPVYSHSEQQEDGERPPEEGSAQGAAEPARSLLRVEDLPAPWGFGNARAPTEVPGHVISLPKKKRISRLRLWALIFAC